MLKKISIVEIISAFVIIIVIAVLILKFMGSSSENAPSGSYKDEIENIVTLAKKMYENDTYKNDTKYFSKVGDVYVIKMQNIEGVELTEDIYGYPYDLDNCYLTFTKDDIIINTKACVKNDTDNTVNECNEIVNVSINDLSESSVKKTFS